MFLAGILELLVYIVQQGGVLVAVGAQTIILVAHLRELHTPALHEREERLARGARTLRMGGWFLIVLSGGLITLEHVLLGASDILLAPAFLFKWTLLLLALLLQLSVRPEARRRFAAEGALGAVWYAVLIIHIAAPVASWTQLSALFVAWVAGFVGLWAGAGMLLRGTSPHRTPVSFPKLSMAMPRSAGSALAQPILRLRAPRFSFAFKKELPPPHDAAPESLPVAVAAPLPVVMRVQEYVEGGLPHIRVMPKTPEELKTRHARFLPASS